MARGGKPSGGWRVDEAGGAMNETPSGESGDVDAAARRLAAALDALEMAVERRRDADHSEEQLAARIQDLGNDRSKLAHELDQAATRMKIGRAHV